MRASTRDCRLPGALLRSDGMWSRGCRKEARLSTALMLSLQCLSSTILTINTTMTTTSTINTPTIATTAARTTAMKSLLGQGQGAEQSGMTLHRKSHWKGSLCMWRGWRSRLFTSSYCARMLRERADSQRGTAWGPSPSRTRRAQLWTEPLLSEAPSQKRKSHGEPAENENPARRRRRPHRAGSRALTVTAVVIHQDDLLEQVRRCALDGRVDGTQQHGERFIDKDEHDAHLWEAVGE